MSRVQLRWVEPGIAELVLEDDAAQNRLSEEMAADLMQVLGNEELREKAKVVLLTGTREVFCAGATLALVRRLTEGVLERKFFEVASKLLSFPVPLIAVLEGHAVGGGLSLSMCCDMAIAAEGSRYGFNFSELGLTPGLGTTGLLPMLVGPSFAAEMLYTGKLYRGSELRARGLFTHVLPAPRVREEALSVARRIAEKELYVLRMLKNTLSMSKRQTLQLAESREELMHGLCIREPGLRQRAEQAYLGS